MARRGVVEEIERLDPERDFERISFLSSNHDFPWDVEQSLSLAFFKTYGIPSISEWLDRTGEFRERAQKRYDDTELILAEILDNGLDSERGREANRRMNRMHGRFEIKNEDYLYVLATFVLVPLRWNRRYGWRRYTRQEELATLHYWRALGRRMNIRDIPATLEEMERWSDEFEWANLRFSESSRHVADDTLGPLPLLVPGPAPAGAPAGGAGAARGRAPRRFRLPSPTRLAASRARPRTSRPGRCRRPAATPREAAPDHPAAASRLSGRLPPGGAGCARVGRSLRGVSFSAKSKFTSDVGASGLDGVVGLRDCESKA